MVVPIDTVFPGLQDTPFRTTSPPSRTYNCIAWAAGDTSRWWWPNSDPENEAVYWPIEVAAVESLDAFAAAFAAFGYAVCSSEELEAGFEKVAIFASADSQEIEKLIECCSRTKQLASRRRISRIAVSPPRPRFLSLF